MAISVLSGGVVWATPSSQALYSWTDLGGGQWRYDFTLYNTSDPISEAGYDLYDFYLSFDPMVTVAKVPDIGSPPDWDFFSDYSSFIQWTSSLPGEPPTGSDIPPGGSLGGFTFISDRLLSPPYFDTYITNPITPWDPVSFSGYATPLLVPEPCTLLLICSGLIGLVGFRRTLRS